MSTVLKILLGLFSIFLLLGCVEPEEPTDSVPNSANNFDSCLEKEDPYAVAYGAKEYFYDSICLLKLISQPQDCDLLDGLDSKWLGEDQLRLFKNFCFAEKSIETGSFETCGRIVGAPELEIGCYSQVAFKIKDISLCNTANAKSIAGCFNGAFNLVVSKVPDSSSCAHVSIPELNGYLDYMHFYCSAEHLFNETNIFHFDFKEVENYYCPSKTNCSGAWAFARNDISLCDNSADERINCYNAFARAKSTFDLNECDNLDENYELCYFHTAINKKDTSICDELPNASQKTNCYQKILKCDYQICKIKYPKSINDQRECLGRGGEWCSEGSPIITEQECNYLYETLYDPASNSLVQTCYSSLVKDMNGSAEYCEKLAGDKRDECYLYVGERDLDLTICMAAGSKAIECQNFVNHLTKK